MRRIIVSLVVGVAALTVAAGPGWSKTAAERRQELQQRVDKDRQRLEDKDRKMEETIIAQKIKRRAFVKDCVKK